MCGETKRYSVLPAQKRSNSYKIKNNNVSNNISIVKPITNNVVNPPWIKTLAVSGNRIIIDYYKTKDYHYPIYYGSQNNCIDITIETDTIPIISIHKCVLDLKYFCLPSDLVNQCIATAKKIKDYTKS